MLINIFKKLVGWCVIINNNYDEVVSLYCELFQKGIDITIIIIIIIIVLL